MYQTQIVKDVLAAINSVKSRAKRAYKRQDMGLYTKLMEDLLALEVVLVGEAEKLVEELEDEAA